MHPAIKAIKRTTSPQYVALARFLPINTAPIQLVTVTTNSFVMINPQDMTKIMSLELFEVFPGQIIAMVALQKEDSKDIIFSIDSDLIVRMVEFDANHEVRSSIYDCNMELPYGMKPRLKNVVYCGAFEQNVLILFENLIYMIVDINEGKVTTFTVSELVGVKATEEIIDVGTYQDQVLLLTSEACHCFKVRMGEYFTKELYESQKFLVEEPVKLCGPVLVNFESVWDPIKNFTIPIDIFVTDVLKLSDQRWILLDREQMIGYVYPEMQRLVLQAEKSGTIVSCDSILVVIGEYTITSFESFNFSQLSQQSMLIPTITNIIQTERELLVLSKTETNSSLYFLQEDYYLDKLTEGKHFGEVQDMWSLKSQSDQHVLISSDQSTHIFQLSNRSQNKVALSEVQETFQSIIKSEATLLYDQQHELQITQYKINSKGEFKVDSTIAFESAAIGHKTCAVLSTDQLQIFNLESFAQLHKISNEGANEVQSFDYLKETDLLLISHWNSNIIEVRDASNWDLLSKVDVADYAPYASLEIDQVATSLILDAHFLFVGLRNGTLLILNVYPQILQKKLNITNQAPVRLQQSKKVGFTKIRNFNKNAAVIFCENQTLIASIDSNSKSNLQELVLKRLNNHVNNLISLAGITIASSQGVINLYCLDGPAFGQNFKQRQVVIQSQYHVQQVLVFQNYIFATVYSQARSLQPALLVISQFNAKIVQKITFEADFLPSAMTYLDSRLYVGLTHMGENDLEKTQTENGNIVSYIFDGFQLTRERSVETFGAVIDLCSLSKQKKILAGINSKVICFDEDLLLKVSQIESQIMIYKIKASEDESEILVADLIKSLTIYSFENSQLQVKSRYPNGQWCFDMTSISLKNDKNYYLSCDFDKNLLFLENNQKSLLDLLVSFHLREQVNSSLILKQLDSKNPAESQIRQRGAAADIFISPSYLLTQNLPRDQSFYTQENESFESFTGDCNIETEVILGSSDGGLYSIKLFDKRVAATLLSLQNQMHTDYSKFSKVQIKGETRQSKAMVYIDLILQFLTLSDKTQAELTDSAMQNKNEGALTVTAQQMRFLISQLK